MLLMALKAVTVPREIKTAGQKKRWSQVPSLQGKPDCGLARWQKVISLFGSVMGGSSHSNLKVVFLHHLLGTRVPWSKASAHPAVLSLLSTSSATSQLTDSARKAAWNCFLN